MSQYKADKTISLVHIAQASNGKSFYALSNMKLGM